MQSPRLGRGHIPNFVPWFGYLSFYPFWTDELIPSVGLGPETPAPPLPPALEGIPTGGLQLDVEPRRAQVYIDGFYAGIVGDFSGYYHHLELPAGPHRVDILLQGYQPQTFSVVVIPGRTTTHRSSLAWTTKGD